MMLFMSVVILALAAFQEVTCQTQCQCDGNVLNQGGWTEWFVTFPQLFYDECQDVHACQATCYTYLQNITSDFDLTAKIEGVPLGEWVCEKLVHDVAPNSSILFQSQSCATGWIDVATIPGFCCINGTFGGAECKSDDR